MYQIKFMFEVYNGMSLKQLREEQRKLAQTVEIRSERFLQSPTDEHLAAYIDATGIQLYVQHMIAKKEVLC